MPPRPSPRKHQIKREAFVARAAELLPHSPDAIEHAAISLYGPTTASGPSVATLRERIEKLIRFHEWFAEGKPAELAFRPEVMPDGEIDPRFTRCWHEAVKAIPSLAPRFTLHADGFRVPLPHGYYRFNRSVLLDRSIDDGSDVTVTVAVTLLRKGGLYRARFTLEGVSLEPLGASFTRWKIALRMLRRYRLAVHSEILRRLHAGVPFEFARDRGELQIALRSGRVPKEIKEDYKRRVAVLQQRLHRVNAALAALADEGRIAAEDFAVSPEIVAAEQAAKRAVAIADYRAARDRFWQVALTGYHKSTLPAWPFRAPTEIRGRIKSSLTHRQRAGLDMARESFTEAFKKVVACGWNPIKEVQPSVHAEYVGAQQILAMEFSS